VRQLERRSTMAQSLREIARAARNFNTATRQATRDISRIWERPASSVDDDGRGRSRVVTQPSPGLRFSIRRCACWQTDPRHQTCGQHVLSPELLEIPSARRGIRLDPQLVVDRMHDPLSGPEVPFRGLHRAMSEQKLDLLQLPTG
jgi:hypothetical protein